MARRRKRDPLKEHRNVRSALAEYKTDSLISRELINAFSLYLFPETTNSLWEILHALPPELGGGRLCS